MSDTRPDEPTLESTLELEGGSKATALTFRDEDSARAPLGMEIMAFRCYLMMLGAQHGQIVLEKQD